MAFALAFGHFELDEARFELRRDGEPVAIQPKVLELLLYLARHRERVVGKDELFETIWDGTVVTEASLSQAVRSARKAVGDSSKEQRVIRTVRGRGLQFVATTTAPAVARRAPRPLTEGRSTAMETRDQAQEGPPKRVWHLVAVVHGEAPRAGGARWCLDDLDEVQLGRGSRRRSTREEGVTRLLSVALPERSASREHARLTRTPTGWLVVDEGSRNGTFVNGERRRKQALHPGDRIACGATMLLVDEAEADVDVDTREQGAGIMATLSVELRRLEEALMRAAPSPLPVLLMGESGTGKSHLARAIHAASGRSVLAVFDANLGQAPAALAAEASGGTLVIEGLERLDEDGAAALLAALDAAQDLRVLATSQRSFQELEARLPRDLLARVAGLRVDLPPLRERIADLGTLAVALMPEPPRLTADAVEALCTHAWPGNLRELGMVLAAAAVVADGAPVTRDHLPPELSAAVTE